jgi:hypothetical protein
MREDSSKLTERVQVDRTEGGEESRDQDPIVDLRWKKRGAVWWMRFWLSGEMEVSKRLRKVGRTDVWETV